MIQTDWVTGHQLSCWDCHSTLLWAAPSSEAKCLHQEGFKIKSFWVKFYCLVCRLLLHRCDCRWGTPAFASALSRFVTWQSRSFLRQLVVLIPTFAKACEEPRYCLLSDLCFVMTECFVIATAELQKTSNIEKHWTTYNGFLHLYF